jgi:hypothetical protein
VKDNFSLIAAAAGGFMLSVALSGVLRGTPVVSWQGHSSLRSTIIADSQPASTQVKGGEFFSRKSDN